MAEFNAADWQSADSIYIQIDIYILEKLGITPRNATLPQARTGYIGGKKSAISVLPVGISSDPNRGMEFLRTDAARKYLAMANQAYYERGILLTPNEGFRTMADQQARWDTYQANGSPVAAAPGTSNHQGGVAVDVTITDSRVFPWLQRNAGKFKWSWDEGQRNNEEWHWRFVG
jgi:LAS superfamily LD-carboxypeptidase LdcB